MTCDPIPPAPKKPVVEHNRAANWLLLLAAVLMAAAIIWSAVGPKGQKTLREEMSNTATPAPTATAALGLRIAAPLSAFPDGGAFLAPGGVVSLSGHDGGTVVLTTEARVAAIATGTPPAVLLDVPADDAPKLQALLANPTPGVLQYIPATPEP